MRLKLTASSGKQQRARCNVRNPRHFCTAVASGARHRFRTHERLSRFGASPRSRKRRRRCALPAQYKPGGGCPDGRGVLSSLWDLRGWVADHPAMNGWAIFTYTSRSFARSAERRRAEARRAGIFVDCRRENDFSSVGAKYAAPDGAGRLNGAGTLQRCRAYGAGHLIPHFVLRWQAERDTAFVRTRGFRTFGASPRARKRRRRCALSAQYKPAGRPDGRGVFFVPPGLAGGRRMTQP